MQDVMLRRTFLRFAAAATLTGLAARSAAADQPTAADLAHDMSLLREALAMHPGLHRYATPALVEERLRRLHDAFVRSRGLEARYLLLSRFLAAIRCGHSYCNFYNQRAPVAAALFDRPTRLPFRFAWIGDAMIVTGDPGGTLPPGTAVLALNGRPAAALRDLLFGHVRADGGNDGKRVSLLEVRGDDAIETFDVFQGLLAPPADGVHRLLVRKPGGGGDAAVELPAIGLAARRAAMTTRLPAPDASRWDWRMRPDGVAVLTMPDWAIWNSGWDWKRWLDDRLDALDGARGLVVDLRDNEGGDNCGDRILARLVERQHAPVQLEQRLRFRRTSARLDPHLDTWDESFRTLGVDATPLGGGFYRRAAGEDDLAIRPAGRRLAAPLVVLTSPVNSSATFQFAANVRALRAGRLVGESTGGNRRGINGGCFFFVRLPASGIEFDLPLVGYFPATPQPDAGILPDVLVRRTAADVAAGRDAAFEAALATLAG